MKKIVVILFAVFYSIILYSQEEDNRSVIHVYRNKDLYSQNKIGKLFINDTLRIGLEGGNYDTLYVKPNCYNLRTNKNKEKINKCFEPNRDYYFKITYRYIFLFGKFQLIEVTKNFALTELKGLKRESLKK